MFPFLLVIFVRSPGWKSKATVLQFSRKRCIVSFLFTETNVQGSCDYLAELSAFGYHIRFSKYCLFVFLLKGLTRHRRWCSTRYRDMDHAKSLNLLNHSNFADKFPKGGMLWGISSSGRAPALHAGSTGIDTRILQDHDFCNNANKFLVFCFFFAVLFCSFI